MKKMILLCSLSAIILFTTGCSLPIEIGRPVAPADLHSINKDMTVQQVKKRLGEPMAVGRDNKGQQTLTWYHLHVILPVKTDTNPKMQRVTITLDSNDRVLDMAYDMSEPAE